MNQEICWREKGKVQKELQDAHLRTEFLWVTLFSFVPGSMLKFPRTITLWPLPCNQESRPGKAWEQLLNCGGHTISLFRTTRIQFTRFWAFNSFLVTLLPYCCLSYSIISTVQPIERKPRKFNPIEIPAKLQQLLPFKSKPKDTPKQKIVPVENRVPVIMQPSEKHTHAALQQLRLIKQEKVMPQAHSCLFCCQPLFFLRMISLYPCRQRRRKLRNNRRRKHTKQRKPRPSNWQRNDRGKRGGKDIGKKISKRSVHADEAKKGSRNPAAIRAWRHVIFCRTCATIFLSWYLVRFWKVQ